MCPDYITNGTDYIVYIVFCLMLLLPVLPPKHRISFFNSTVYGRAPSGRGPMETRPFGLYLICLRCSLMCIVHLQLIKGKEAAKQLYVHAVLTLDS